MRDDRNRMDDQRQALDLADGPAPARTARMLVQIFDGGSIPTDVPKVYLTHPALADSGDTEGDTPTYAADTSRTIPVVVLGPKVPGAGDLLVAHAVAGRWLAGSGGSAPVGCDDPCVDCRGSGVPNKDLLLTWTGTGDAGSGSQVLRADCGGSWQTDCFGPDGLMRWTLTCGGDPYTLRLDYHHYATVCGGTSFPEDDSSDFIIGTIYPFTVTLDLVTGTPPTYYFYAREDGYETVTISDPAPDTYCCFVYLIVYGCNSSFASPGDPVPGATVTVWTDSGKTTQIATGTTDFAGVVDLVIGNHAGSIYYEVDALGFDVYGLTLTVACGEYTVDNPLTTTVPEELYGAPVSALVVADGYICLGSCASPVPLTLHATHPKFGPITYTYDGAGAHGAGWYGTATYSYPGAFCCPAATVTVACFLSTSFAYREDWISA